jgi:cytochrome c556
MKRLTKYFLALAGLTVVLGSAVPVYSAGHQMKLLKERNSTMKALSGAMKGLKGASDTATMKTHAMALQAASAKLGNMWPDGSIGESRAKPEIWQNMGDFKAKLKAMDDAAANLVRVSGGSDLGAAKKAFGAVGATCGGCHKVYRGPKKDK